MKKWTFSIIIISLLFSCQVDNEIIEETIVPHQTTPYDLSFDGYPIIDIPENNPMTEEGIELGRHLFYDPAINCNACHLHEKSFSSSNNIPIEIEGSNNIRNVMPLVNLAWVEEYSWGGRDNKGLEEKVHSSIITSSQKIYSDVISDLKASHVDYAQMYFDAFGREEINEESTNKALAQFIRTMTATNSRAQRYIDGDASALNSFEQFGFTLFFTEKGNCFHCHLNTNKLFTDNSFRNNGLDSVWNLSDFEDYGAYYQTGNDFDKGKFRSVTLLNIAQTAPYMHDGRFETLEEVVEHYNSGGEFAPNKDNLIDEDPSQVGLGLSEQEKAALVAFLGALSDTSYLNNDAFANPFLE